jgi:DNA-binding XRE family transcriptional regulator
VRRYLLDTTPLTAYLRGIPTARALIEPWITRQEAATNVLIYGEVTGYNRSFADAARRQHELRLLLDEVFPYVPTYSILERYAELPKLVSLCSTLNSRRKPVMAQTVSFREMLHEQMKDPDFRAEWERTAFARAVANQVIKYRIDHGLSQTALARRLGVSQSVVGRLELGEHEPKISTLRRLSQVLGLRFGLDIHPAGQPPLTTPSADATVERFTSNGVELLISAG